MSTQTEITSQQTTGTSPSRPWRWLVSVAAAIAVVVALALTAAFGHVGSISIISGWFPVALFWVTVAVCLIAVVLRRDVLKEFAIGIPIGIVFTVLLFVGLHLMHTIQLDGLDSLYVWLCVACLLAGLVVAGWRRDEFWQRAFRYSLPWLSWKLKLTPQPQSIPAQCVAGKSLGGSPIGAAKLCAA